jgi:hypothetical protein
VAFTTYVKLQLNTLLKPIGVEVGTTLKRRTEAARIQRLQSFEILWPARYMWEYYRPAVLDLIPADANIFPPSSLWLKKLR